MYGVKRQLRAALMFSCLGRGLELYGVPNHESELVCRHLGAVPIGGFFANGEIGPVRGRTFVHGYTSVFGAFCEPVLTAKPQASNLEHALGES